MDEACLLGHVGQMRIERTAGRLAARLCFYATRRNPLSEYGAVGAGDRCTRHPSHREHPFAPGDHWIGSTALSTWRAFTFSNFCTTPDGQRISTSLAVESLPNPAMTRLSLADRYPTAVLTV